MKKSRDARLRGIKSFWTLVDVCNCPGVIVMAGGYAADLDDIVDIHAQTGEMAASAMGWDRKKWPSMSAYGKVRATRKPTSAH